VSADDELAQLRSVGLQNAQSILQARRRAEDALRQSEHFLKRITDVVPGVIQVFDLVDKRTVFMNRSVASLLGYSLRQTTPVFVQPEEHVTVERGEGTELRAFRIPGTNLEFMVASFGPQAQFAAAVTHAGLDVMYVAEGDLVLVVDGVDYPLRAGECAVWPSSHAHAVRNDADSPARAIGFATEAVY